MKGQEFLNRHIGHKLTGGLVQSFYLDNELADLINVTFLKFENEWIQIVTTDEQTSIRPQDSSIELTGNVVDEKFKYPIRPIESIFPDFSKYLGKTFLSFKELVLKDNETMSFGLILNFSDNLVFTIRNIDYPEDRNEYYFDTVTFHGLREK